MNTLIPLEYYPKVYLNILLVFTLLVYSQSIQGDIQSLDNLKAKNKFGLFVLFFILLFIGFRPISIAFGDMWLYAIEFKDYSEGMVIHDESKDVLFSKFTQICSGIMPAEFFFFICTALYTLPLYTISKKIFKEYWFYSFFMLVISFSFWAYGVNGIRNGIATSIFLLGISRDNKIWTIAIMILATLIHKTLMLPLIAYFITLIYDKPKLYLYFWIISIPMSFILGGLLGDLLMSLGFVEEDRLAGYLNDNQQLLDVAIKVGFRWDFILYSFSGVYSGWYFIVKKNFKDVLYNQLYCMYLLTNGVWIILIRANFSNRFAYLSWFMLGLIIIYPLLKIKFYNSQHKFIGKLILIYFLFTYLSNII